MPSAMVSPVAAGGALSSHPASIDSIEAATSAARGAIRRMTGADRTGRSAPLDRRAGRAGAGPVGPAPTVT